MGDGELRRFDRFVRTVGASRLEAAIAYTVFSEAPFVFERGMQIANELEMAVDHVMRRWRGCDGVVEDWLRTASCELARVRRVVGQKASCVVQAEMLRNGLTSRGENDVGPMVLDAGSV